jgi:hypothetical protein
MKFQQYVASAITRAVITIFIVSLLIVLATNLLTLPVIRCSDLLT